MGVATYSAFAYASAAINLLPPGKLRDDQDGVIYRVFLANGDELARVSGRVADMLREADPRTTDELLPEWEEMLGLTAEGTKDERRARVVARVVRRQRFRPVDFQDVLAPILGLDPSDVEIIERSRSDAVAMNDDREIYRFFAYRDPGLAGSYSVDDAQAELDRMKPSHTRGHVIESDNFLTDDEFSLTDRDILGA